MTEFYHPNRAAAEVAKRELLATHGDRVETVHIQFEAYNGFVLCAVPKPVDLSDLHNSAEVIHPGTGRRLSPPNKEKKFGPKMTQPDKGPGSRGPRIKNIVDLDEEDRLLSPTEIKAATAAALQGWKP